MSSPPPPPPLPHPKIYTHDPSGTTLFPHLLPLLPATLPLVRRLQFHHRSRHTRVLASFPPAAGLGPGLECRFTAAFCDRSRAAETEMWVFCGGLEGGGGGGLIGGEE